LGGGQRALKTLLWNIEHRKAKHRPIRHTFFPSGSTLVITTKNNAPKNYYIESVTINGKQCNFYQLTHEIFVKGGNPELELGPDPNQAWGGRIALASFRRERVDKEYEVENGHLDWGGVSRQ
jgi:hypothetical protein